MTPVLVIGAMLVALQSAQASSRAAPFACSSNKGSFTPTRAIISHVGKVQVITVGRNRDGSMGTPPLNNTGKHQLAWYNKSSHPGSRSGGVATDAHTWPDGSALGNKLYGGLVVGDTIALYDRTGHHRACYKVTQRQQYASNRVPMRRVVSGDGKGQILSIVVCSGTRRGPGDWSQRTVWTAVWNAPPAPSHKRSPSPSPSPSPSGGIIGGILGGL